MNQNINNYQTSNLRNKAAHEKCSYIYYRLQFFLENCHASLAEKDHMKFYINSNKIIDICSKMSSIFTWEPSLGEEFKATCMHWDKYFISLLIMVNKYISCQDDKNFHFLMNHFKIIEENWKKAKLPDTVRQQEKAIIKQSYEDTYI